MAEAKAKGGKGKGLSKRVGPLPVWGWAVAGGAGFLLYRFLRARSVANAGAAATGTTGGTTIPPGSIPTTSSVGQAAGTFASVTAWEQALLSFLTGNGMSPGEAFSAVTSFLNGNCVSQAAYNGISQALVSSSVGLPPGFSTNVPTLSVCPSPVQTPTPSNPTPQQPTKVQSRVLPYLNAQLFPQTVLFGQYGANDYTKVGTVVNGQYQGAGVQGGAPVYAGVYGGFVQDFNMATLPNGTDIYVPTGLLDYVQGRTPSYETIAAA